MIPRYLIYQWKCYVSKHKHWCQRKYTERLYAQSIIATNTKRINVFVDFKRNRTLFTIQSNWSFVFTIVKCIYYRFFFLVFVFYIWKVENSNMKSQIAIEHFWLFSMIFSLKNLMIASWYFRWTFEFSFFSLGFICT